MISAGVFVVSVIIILFALSFVINYFGAYGSEDESSLGALWRQFNIVMRLPNSGGSITQPRAGDKGIVIRTTTTTKAITCATYGYSDSCQTGYRCIGVLVAGKSCCSCNKITTTTTTRTTTTTSICKNLCGDGICQKVVCMAVGCPCLESSTSCPGDCGGGKLGTDGEGQTTGTGGGPPSEGIPS